MIFAIVLAAGASTRMGRPKQLLPIPGGTILSTVVSRLLEAPVDRVVVVLGQEAEAVRSGAGLPRDPRVTVVENEGWREGMASSLRRGLAACVEADAVLVALGDQPGIEPRVVAELAAAGRAGSSIAFSTVGDRADHPVLFHRRLWPELLALRGDVGGREVLKRHWAEAVRIRKDESNADLDTPEDLKAFLGRAAEGTPRNEGPAKGRTRRFSE